MPRENLIPPEQKKRESEELSRIFDAAQKREDGLTQFSLALEMDVSQGMVQKWLSGSSAIPAKRLLWLSKRLNFDPRDVRPDFDLDPQTHVYTAKETRTLEIYRKDPHFRKIVDAIAETSPFYNAAQKHSDESHQ